MARENLKPMPMSTLREAMDANLKLLTFYRIALAFTVFVSHAFPIFLGKNDPQVPFFWRSSISFGTFAVGGFFALSGLLLYSSANRLPPRVWIIRRSLRLLPAYAACLLFCSFVLSPIAVFLQNRNLNDFFNFGPVGPFAYTWNNLFMPVGITYALNDSFSTTPYGVLTGGASVVNGSIWSLPYEIRCYLVLGFVCYLFSYKFRDKLLPLLTCATFLGYLLSGNTQFQRLVAPLWKFSDPLFLQLLSIFLFGACFGIYAKRITLNFRLLIALLILYYFTTFYSELVSTIGIAVVVLIPFVVGKLFLESFERWNFSLWDISYGFYLYSFPIQQMTVQLFPNLPFPALILMALLATLALSILSYKLIESPAINFGKSVKL